MHMWIARIGGLCRGLHESASYELCRRRERSLPDGYTCTHDLYLQMESEGIQYDELSTVMLMGNTMSWDIIRDSMATSLENYRRLSDANPNPNPNPRRFNCSNPTSDATSMLRISPFGMHWSSPTQCSQTS